VVRFAPAQARQLATVLRLRPGARVAVFDGRGDVDHLVELVSVSPPAATGKVVGSQPSAPEPRTALVAYPALLARDKFDQVVQKLVEVGASAIVPVQTRRAIVRGRPEPGHRQRWQRIAQEAAEQCGRGRVPPVGGPRQLAEALPEAAARGAVLLADPGALADPGLGPEPRPLRAALRDLCRSDARRVSIFVGPEGGFAPEEVALARASGADVVSLGPRILRTETASPVLAALVLYELEAPPDPGEAVPSREHPHGA
jgi:16S rRNA (uracil1498-N3)-methyltransferase